MFLAGQQGRTQAALNEVDLENIMLFKLRRAIISPSLRINIKWLPFEDNCISLESVCAFHPARRIPMTLSFSNSALMGKEKVISHALLMPL